MNKPIQKRAIATRARLIEVAKDLISKEGFAALRIDDVVKQAGVAKGTFFSHFKDKDQLMVHILGEGLSEELARLTDRAPPLTATEMTAALYPFFHIMGYDRAVFDIAIRYSGAAAETDIGPVAEAFWRMEDLCATWLSTAGARTSGIRQDVSPQLLSEGIQAFAIQAFALNFCALSRTRPIQERLTEYFKAWLYKPT